MNIDKIERISKVMEKWHNRLYRWFCIIVFVIVADIVTIGIIGWSNYRSVTTVLHDEFIIIAMYDFIIYVGSPAVLFFLAYSLLFTRFQFPIRFGGDGRGQKYAPPPSTDQ